MNDLARLSPTISRHATRGKMLPSSVRMYEDAEHISSAATSGTLGRSHGTPFTTVQSCKYRCPSPLLLSLSLSLPPFYSLYEASNNSYSAFHVFPFLLSARDATPNEHTVVLATRARTASLTRLICTCDIEIFVCEHLLII